eukprot:jgi/Picre1/31648/NNA_006999.t1
MGVKCNGFYGDTMHMARLWDSSRTGRGGYSLEALTTEEDLMGPLDMTDARGKISMKKIFGRPNIKKDGTEGKLIILPPIEELQSSEETRWDWINYSAYDAKATWELHEALVLKLMGIYTAPDAYINRAYQQSGIEIKSLWDIYCHVWRPFGDLLTDLEAYGVAVDVDHLSQAEKQATEEEANSSQVVQLLFGGAKNRNKDKPGVPLSRTFKVPNMLPPEDGKKPKKNMDITIHNVWSKDVPTKLVPEIYTPAGLPGCSTQVLKTMAGKPGRARKALAQLTKDRKTGEEGIESVRSDFDDVWSTDDAEISKLQEGMNLAKKEEPIEVLDEIAKQQGFGRLFSLFGNREEGLKACAAVDSLIDASAIDTLLSNFIVPLQSDAILKSDSSGVQRVHCSLNINTETDRNKGNTLIVADYGQLELRILAHMANCSSMIDAFELGGDFHSRTALGMYDHIKKAVDQGDCLLEWDENEGKGEPPVPLLKDMFSAERRRAKVLNFSIAYGKTAHGLSKDWGVTLKEAEETWNDGMPNEQRQHSASCTSTFENEQVRENLSSVVSTLDDQIHMKDVLVRLHRQHLEDESISVDDEDELVGGIPYIRAMAFAEGNLKLEDLTETWSPWWESQEAKDMTLTDQGMPVVQDLEPTGTTSEVTCSLPKAPESPLPALSSLTSKNPSPLLMYHLIDLVFWYALALRLLNGDFESAETDVVCLLLSCSKALTPGKQITEDIGLENVIIDILQTACTGVKPYFGSIPRGMAIGAVRDVVGIISLGRTGAFWPSQIFCEQFCEVKLI